MSLVRFLLVVSAAALTGCLSWFEPPPPQPINVFRSELQTQDTVIDNLSINVKMLLDEDIASHSVFMREIPYVYRGSDGSVILESTSTWSIVSAPVFELKLTNNGERTLLFDAFNARLLVDDEVFDPSSTSLIYQATSQALERSSPSSDYDTSFIKAGAVPLLERGLELLPGIPQTLYLVFHAYSHLDNKRTTVDSVTLRLFDVPVNTDEASGVARTEMITFDFPLSTLTIIPE